MWVVECHFLQTASTAPISNQAWLGDGEILAGFLGQPLSGVKICIRYTHLKISHWNPGSATGIQDQPLESRRFKIWKNPIRFQVNSVLNFRVV